MRILHVIPSGTQRGGQIFASDLIASIRTVDIEHRVALLRPGDRSAVRFDAPVNVLGPDGFEIPGLNMSPTAVWALRTLVASWKPDIIQTHGGEPLKYTLFATRGGRIPVVFRSVGTAPVWIRRGFRRSVWASLMRRSAQVVAVAEAIRLEMIRTFKIPAQRVVTIPNGVDSRRLRPERSRDQTRKLLGIPEGHPVMLSLGALTWEKDPLIQVEVSARLRKQGHKVTHLIAGDGPMRGQVQQAANSRGLDGRVIMLGSRTDVADLLEAADVMLFASRPDGMEGMPATVIEAGMMARPVVAYSVAGVPEVVEDGKTGLLAAPGDLNGLTEAMIRLLDDTEKRREIGAAAQRRCLSLFEITPVAEQYRQLYRSLVRSH